MIRILHFAAIIPILVPLASAAVGHDIAVRSHANIMKRRLERDVVSDDGWVFDDEYYGPPREAEPFDDQDDWIPPSGEDIASATAGPQLEERKYYKKVAVPWPNAIPSALEHLRGTDVFGMYTWSPYCPPQAKQYGIRCFPMLWGYKSIGQFKQYVKPGYSDHALGPNECNQAGQSQLSPGAAAALWKEYLYPLRKHGYTLVSPSTSNAKNSVSWMQEYLRICPECRSGRYAAHYYGTKASSFISYMTDMHKATGNGTLWITETACQNFGEGENCSASEAREYMEQITEWAEKTPWVEMIAFFGFFSEPRDGVSKANALLNSDGTLNSMGKAYIYG